MAFCKQSLAFFSHKLMATLAAMQARDANGAVCTNNERILSWERQDSRRRGLLDSPAPRGGGNEGPRGGGKGGEGLWYVSVGEAVCSPQTEQKFKERCITDSIIQQIRSIIRVYTF